MNLSHPHSETPIVRTSTPAIPAILTNSPASENSFRVKALDQTETDGEITATNDGLAQIETDNTAPFFNALR